MKSLICHALMGGIYILSGVLLASLGLEGLPSNSSCDEGVDLQIITDRASYTQGATMHVKLLVTNTGKTPLYLFRGVGQCTSPFGSLRLDIRDQNGNEVDWLRNSKDPFSVDDLHCSMDAFTLDTLDVVEALGSQKTGVVLEEGQIFGREQSYVMPKRKGTYLLRAELNPPGFLTDEQKKALAQHYMRVLRGTCFASPVTITVK
jgi:hypothetical protein